MIYEAEVDDGSVRHSRDDVVEVALYSSVLRRAQNAVSDGEPINEGLIKNAHRVLLSLGRGASKSPGQYKTEQNYIGDDRRKVIFFKPISPIQLEPAMHDLLRFIEQNSLPQTKFIFSNT